MKIYRTNPAPRPLTVQSNGNYGGVKVNLTRREPPSNMQASRSVSAYTNSSSNKRRPVKTQARNNSSSGMSISSQSGAPIPAISTALVIDGSISTAPTVTMVTTTTTAPSTDLVPATVITTNSAASSTELVPVTSVVSTIETRSSTKLLILQFMSESRIAAAKMEIHQIKNNAAIQSNHDFMVKLAARVDGLAEKLDALPNPSI